MRQVVAWNALTEGSSNSGLSASDHSTAPCLHQTVAVKKMQPVADTVKDRRLCEKTSAYSIGDIYGGTSLIRTRMTQVLPFYASHLTAMKEVNAMLLPPNEPYPKPHFPSLANANPSKPQEDAAPLPGDPPSNSG